MPKYWAVEITTTTVKKRIEIIKAKNEDAAEDKVQSQLLEYNIDDEYQTEEVTNIELDR